MEVLISQSRSLWFTIWYHHSSWMLHYNSTHLRALRPRRAEPRMAMEFWSRLGKFVMWCNSWRRRFIQWANSWRLNELLRNLPSSPVSSSRLMMYSFDLGQPHQVRSTSASSRDSGPASFCGKDHKNKTKSVDSSSGASQYVHTYKHTQGWCIFSYQMLTFQQNVDFPAEC